MTLKNIVYYDEHNKIVDAWTLSENTVVVSPTGSGKTVILIRLLDKFLCKNPSAKTLVLCPTNILTDQTYASFKNFSDHEVARISGPLFGVDQLKTVNICTGHRAILNFTSGLWTKELFSLVAFDEVHKMSTPKSPYAQINQFLQDTSCVMLGFTATLIKKSRKKILRCFKVSMAVEGTSPVSWSKQVCYEKVAFTTRRNLLFDRSRTSLLRTYGKSFSTPNRLGLDTILEEPQKMFSLLNRRKLTFSGRSKVKDALNLRLLRIIFLRYFYFYESYETYESYLKKFVKNKALFWNYLPLFQDYVNEKFERIKQLLVQQKTTTIVFMDNYTTLVALRAYLQKVYGGSILTLGGKSKIGVKERRSTLEQIKKTPGGVILTTSVAEEGLDIGSADLVIFFRPVLNEVNYTQRKGRTGRHAHGKIAILYYDGTVERDLVKQIQLSYEKSAAAQEQSVLS